MGNDDGRKALIDEIYRLRRSIAELEGVEKELFQTSGGLKRRNACFRLLADNSMCFVLVIDKKLDIKYVLPPAERIFGYSDEYLTGKDLSQFINPDDISAFKVSVERAVSEPESTVSVCFELKFSDGLWHSMLGTLKNMLSEPCVKGLVGSFTDITKYKNAEAELEAEKERLVAILGSIGEGVIGVDSGGIVILLNGTAEKLTGWRREEAVGKSLNDIFNIIDEKTRMKYADPVGKVLNPRGVSGIDSHTILIDRNGGERIISDNGLTLRDKCGNESGTIIAFRDITEKVRMEEDLFRASRIESVGILAGGIAHDFNNILAVLLGNISLARMELETGRTGSLADRLSSMENASLQARSLTEQLLTFSKGGSPVRKFASIGGLLKDASSFAIRGSNVKCELEIPDDLWTVKIDSGQINQVINNLIINAKQAMPGGGMITISAGNVPIGEEDVLLLNPGNYVCFSVRDNGVGIAKENIGKIFDPYFTTKPHGTGLGLATSYSIIRRHGGCITVDSAPGAGTEFHVYIPAFPDRAVPNAKRQVSFIHGQGNVLVMDDQKDVRNVLGMMLEAAGYHVGYAGDGEEAVKLYRESMRSGKKYDAVIMDLTIPGGMGGVEAVRELIQIDPDVKAIASSGYSNGQVMGRYRKFGFKAIVAKPFEIKELSSILNKVITGAE